MLSILESVLHGILSVPYYVVGFLVDALNVAIVGVAGLGAAALAVLPGFPKVEGLPSGVLGGFLWFFPLGALASVFTAMVAAYVTFLGVKAALKWSRLL